MKFGVIDTIFPGLTNVIDMTTGVFKDVGDQHSLNNGVFCHKNMLRLIFSEFENDFEKLFHKLKSKSNLDGQTINYIKIQHKLYNYINFPRVRTKESLKKLKRYLANKPLFKNYVIKNKKTKKELLVIKNKLIINNSFAFVNKINNLNFEHGVIFTSSTKDKEYFYYYLMILKSEKVPSNHIVWKQEYAWNFEN